MANPFLAEIRIVTFNFAPTGWAFCDGQLLPISQNTALFSLLGTTYGGNGTSNFALPNLQGSAPLQPGQGPGLCLYSLGQTGGESRVTLIQSEMPTHNHVAEAHSLTSGDRPSPQGTVWSKAQYGRQGQPMYTGASPVAIAADALAAAGRGQPHHNLMPYLTLNFIIALQGVYPARA